MGLHNAAYHGPFVNKAREVFSNTGTANMNRWQTYVKGDPKRQDILETPGYPRNGACLRGTASAGTGARPVQTGK